MNSCHKQLAPNAFSSILVEHEKLEQHTILNQLLTLYTQCWTSTICNSKFLPTKLQYALAEQWAKLTNTECDTELFLVSTNLSLKCSSCLGSTEILDLEGNYRLSHTLLPPLTMSRGHYQENEVLVRLSAVSFSDDLVHGTESKEGLLSLSCWWVRILASFWVCSFTHSRISLPCWVKNWNSPSPALQPLKI